VTRLNITLPNHIAIKIAAKRNKSRFIVEALEEKLEREKKKQIEHLLIEGYRVTGKEDTRLYDDWESAGLEGWE